MARRIAVVMSTGLIPDRNTREKAPLTPLSTALSKRSKMLIVVLSSFPRAVCATYVRCGSEAAPSHSLTVARSGVAPTVGMFPMSKGLRARIEGPSWQGIPCHDAPATFGAYVTRVTISVLEQTECGQVVSHVWSRLVAIRLLVFCLGEIVSGCDLALRTLLTVMQCTIEGSDRSVGAPGSFVLDGRVWGDLFKK